MDPIYFWTLYTVIQFQFIFAAWYSGKQHMYIIELLEQVNARKKWYQDKIKELGI